MLFVTPNRAPEYNAPLIRLFHSKIITLRASGPLSPLMRISLFKIHSYTMSFYFLVTCSLTKALILISKEVMSPRRCKSLSFSILRSSSVIIVASSGYFLYQTHYNKFETLQEVEGSLFDPRVDNLLDSQFPLLQWGVHDKIDRLTDHMREVTIASPFLKRGF